VLTYTNTALESNKTYYYIIRAVNEFGAAKNSNEASVTTIKDLIPPTAPSNLQYKGSTQSTVDLSWTGSTDNVGVDRYDVFVNGNKIYSTTQTSGTVSGLDSLTLYTFVVKARDAAGNYSQSSNQESGYTHRQGINYKYYTALVNWSVLPNFNSGTQATLRSTGTMKNVTAGLEFRIQENNNGILWEGFIYIPVAGSYTFETNSDDGSKLHLATYNFSATPIVDNDGIHNMQLRSGTVNLNRGYYPITIPYFDRSGNEGLEVYWTGPGITRERIPDNYLALTNFTIPTVPATPTNLVGTTPSYSQVNLGWTYTTNSITGFEVVRSTTAGGTYLPIGTVASTVRSFIDSNRTANTQYFYKVRAIRAGNFSAFSNTLAITTPNTPPAPPEPPRPTLTIMSTSAIRVNWTDNAPSETAWRIERSINNNISYRLIATLPAAAGTGSNISFIDSNLFANVNYWYRIQAVGNGTLSPYSLQGTIRTPNTKPEFRNLKDFTMKINTTYALPVEATDVDGDVLTFTAAGLPYFATIQNVSNGNANIVFTPSAAAQGAYSVAVFVHDGNNGRDTTYFTIVVNENGVPVMNALSNITMDEGDLLNVPLVANDQEGNSRIFWYFENKPSFVTFTNNGNGRGSLRIAPSFGHSGIYRMTVFADDGYGAWTSRSFSIEVVDTDPNETIQANFTWFNPATPKWNEISLDAQSGTQFSISNMKNVKDSVTTVGINALTAASLYGATNDGSQSPSNTGVYPNSVMLGQLQWGFFAGGNHRDTMRIRVSGLSLTKKYNFIFFASHKTIAGITTYNIGSQSAVVNFYQNTTMTDTIYQVSPNTSGEIFITMVGDPNTSVGGVLTALIIQSQFDDGSAPAKPEDLSAVFIDNVGVRLSWLDQSYNENAFQVYRSTTRSGGYSLLNSGMNNKDSVGYVDENPQPFTQYYYYVRGINNVGPGISSDTVGILTGNSKPQITGLGNMFAKIGTTVTEDFSVADSPGDILNVALANSPSFVSLIPLGGNNYRISAAPTTDHIGWQQVTVMVTDDKGGITNQRITITVADSRTRSFYINLGQLGTTAQAPWNNWINQRLAGSAISNLVDENNGASTLGAQLLNDWNGFTPLGHITGNESGVFPDAVLSSGLSDNSGTTKQIRFTGLDNTKFYNIVFVGSQNEGMNAIATYTSGTHTATLNGRYNTQHTASLNGLIPSSGAITVNISKDAGSPSMFLNGIQIEEYTSNSPLMNPLNLYVEPRDRNSVFINWTDRSINETGFQVQRATNPAFTSPITTSYGAGVTTATVTGLNPNTRYYFRVRAVNGTNSFYSNVVSTITPQQMVMVNFNFTVASAPFPWNNLELQPNLLETYTNLKDQSGVNSGIGLSITKVFNGEFNAGMNTGSNSGIVPDNVLQANYWLDNSQQSQIRITGLNQTKYYRFGFVGSSSPNGWFAGNYTATYTIGNRTTYLNSWQNTSKIVYIGDVLPDSNGEVLLNFSTTAAAQYAFNAGIIIEAYNDPVGGTVVNGMVFEGQDVEAGPLVAADNAAAREAKVKMYPNPFIDNVNIDFLNSSASNNISVDVVDLSGKLVYRRVYGKLSQGYTTLRLNTVEGNIRKGIYFFILNVNGKPVSAGKMIRTRQ
jgi:chitodextrinase